jgi:hypothetical protein
MNILKKFFCCMGWHSILVVFDGCSEHAKCKWCDYEGIVDSQGNLF